MITAEATPAWRLVERVAFRFAIVFGALVVYPFPIGALPKTEAFAAVLNQPLEWLVGWFATAILGLPEPSTAQTGAGDTTFAYVALLVYAIVASLATLAWSLADRRRVAYPRLAAGARIALRYWLAFTLLQYGFAKLVGGQFPPPGPGRLDERVGEMSPMGMLWTFMGASSAYTKFGGLAELVPGLLLLWRRTAALGALCAIAVMTNVVVLNFCYDVPVKLFSLELLVAAVLVALPDARRVLAAVLGLPVPPPPPPGPSMSIRRARVRLVTAAAIGIAIAWQLYDVRAQIGEGARPFDDLVGIWDVETFAADGATLPPLATDRERWWKLIVSARGVAVKRMSGELVPLVTAEHDAAAQQLTIAIGDTRPEIWRYRRADRQLVLDGRFGGKQLHVTLSREPEPLLVTRGFHWVQEVPFNR